MKAKIVPNTRIQCQTTRPNAALSTLDLTVVKVWRKNDRDYMTGLTADGNLTTVRADRIVPFVYTDGGTVTSPIITTVDEVGRDMHLSVMPGFSAQYGFVEDVDSEGKALLIAYQGGQPIVKYEVESVEIEICGPQELLALNQTF